MLAPRSEMPGKPVMALAEMEKDYIISPASDNATSPTCKDTDVITGEYIPFDWLVEEPPAHEFCVNPYAPIGVVTIINGHGGVGKSLMALKMAVHIALGLPFLTASTNGGKVAYMSLEDSATEFRQRVYKVAHTLPYKLAPRLPALTKKLMFINRCGIPTLLASHPQGRVVETEIPAALIDLLKAHDVKCLITDTFIRTHSLNENDNAQMGALLVLFEKVAKEAECAVILIHHQPKDKGNKDYASRGASAITDNARSVLCLERVSKKDAEKFSEEHVKTAARAGRLVRVEHTKQNYTAKHPDQYFEITSDGMPMERFPAISDGGGLEQRYAEIFLWCQNVWEGKPITKNTIDAHYTEMRPEGTTYGKATYKKALQAAVDEGYAVEAPPPEGASKNSNAKYYSLHSLEEEPFSPPEPPVTSSLETGSDSEE